MLVVLALVYVLGLGRDNDPIHTYWVTAYLSLVAYLPREVSRQHWCKSLHHSNAVESNKTATSPGEYSTNWYKGRGGWDETKVGRWCTEEGKSRMRQFTRSWFGGGGLCHILNPYPGLEALDVASWICAISSRSNSPIGTGSLACSNPTLLG